MNWEKLLQPLRLGCPKDEAGHNPDRTQFQRDYDRIIFSTAFRRLNGKTQVFPFPESDVIHTRLTHSLECASVGRSLGTIVRNKLIEKYGSDFNNYHLGAIVSAACLAHDIGNPPLGHSGEKAFSEYFTSERGQAIIKDLTAEQKCDFTNFEGNSMGFHMLTFSNPFLTNVPGGLGLTFPVLAAFTKYPRPSIIENRSETVCEKKPGILQCDIKVYEEIANDLEIPKKTRRKTDHDKWYRHPLAFLTEAADDICYAIMDFEDGYKHNLINYEKIYALLLEICKEDPSDSKIDGLENIIDKKNKIGYLRAKAINSLTYQAVETFIKNEEEILNGKLKVSLCSLINSATILKEINNISIKNIYEYKSVLQVEAAGFRVLPGLLDTFLYACKEPHKASSKKVLQLIPPEYQCNFNENPYDTIVYMTTYVAGMTDTFAVDTYRNLRGIHLPNYY
jgi:dGTPase